MPVMAPSSVTGRWWMRSSSIVNRALWTGVSAGRLITGRLTQQDLAQMVGSSREMVSRIFTELKKGGYIEIENKRIIINKKLPARW